MGDRDRYIHLKEIFVNFIKRRPTSDLELRLAFRDEAGVKHKSSKFKRGDLVHWNLDIYVRANSCAVLTIRRLLFKTSVAQIEIQFKPNEFEDHNPIELEDSNHRVTVSLVCDSDLVHSERFKSLADGTLVLDSQARTNLASTAPRFLELPQAAALPRPTSERGYDAQCPAIHQLNNDILLGIFSCYRLNVNNGWNVRLGWRKLSHVCQRWRHLIYECAAHLGMYIKCTNGSPTVDMLDHLPPLPLFVDYYGLTGSNVTLTEQDESGIYHALQLHDRVYHIDLKLPPSILHKVFVFLDEQFPILEHISLTFSATSQDIVPPTLPKAFLAPNLRYLTLPSIRPSRRLQLLTSTVFLVTLELRNIQASSYFRPRLLVARLRSLSLLEELFITFSIPLPRPSTERELLGGQGTPITLPSLKKFWFKGVSAYLESLIAQIRAPLLEQLTVTLFNQIAFALPHLFHLINITQGFKPPGTMISFCSNEVSITVTHSNSSWSRESFRFLVICTPLDWQIDCAVQICHALIPALSGVEQLSISCDRREITTELWDGATDSAMWHDLLAPFIGLNELNIDSMLSEEISRALQGDEVWSDPGFLPNLRSGSPSSVVAAVAARSLQQSSTNVTAAT